MGLIRYAMPWLGLGLLDIARAFADFDLPARVGPLFLDFSGVKISAERR